jgi:hypothetical protein
MRQQAAAPDFRMGFMLLMDGSENENMPGSWIAACANTGVAITMDRIAAALMVLNLAMFGSQIDFLAERASAAAADVQPFVELFILLVLLGIEYRHILLLNLFRRRTRRKLRGAGLQMADRRAAIHRRPGASDGGRIADGIAQNKGTAEDHRYEMSCAHVIAPPRLSA